MSPHHTPAPPPRRRTPAALMLPALLLVGCGESRPEPGDPGEVEADTLGPFAVADRLSLDGRADEAAPRFLALRDSFAVAGDTANQWRAQFWWADALITLGHQDSARAALAGALELAARDPSLEGRTRERMSLLLRRRGETQAALEEAMIALDLARQAGDRSLEATVQGGLGGILSNAGRYHESLDANERALALQRELGATADRLAQALNNLGIDYRHFGRFTDAAEVYEEALGHARQTGSPIVVAMVLYNLANIHAAAGDAGQALTLMLESLRHAEEVGDPRGLGFLHGGLANLYTRAGNHGRARWHVLHALEINRTSRHVYGQALALESLGRLERTEGDLVAADTTLREALALADDAGFGRERSTVRSALARTSAAGGRAAEATAWAEAALAIADSIGDPAVQIEALEAAASAREAAGDAGAIETYLGAIELLESWRGRLTLGDLRMGVAEPRMAAYEGAIRGLVAAGRTDEALGVAERARARLLREIMAERDAREGRLSREAELRRELRERFAARAAARADTLRDALDAEIAALTTALDSLALEARRRDPAAGEARYPTPATPASVQAELLGPGRALLAFFWGDRDVYGWWVTATGIRAARLGSADSLATTVGYLRSAMEDPASGDRWAAAAHRLYRDLVAPLDPTPHAEVLVLADGPLSHIPVEVLVPAVGGRPWGYDRQFVYGPSASVLLALQAAGTTRDWQRAVLAVGNPVAARGTAAAFRTDAAALAPLPHAVRESRAIRALFRSDGADLLVGRRATLERWLALDPSRYRYLHFAAHARIDDRRPERTHVVLAGQDLDLAAIRRLDLHAELVTLSACETALGRRVRGEGIIGLPHAFLAAGARGVLVTLWRIDDRWAADFMRQFYREVHAGRQPAAALLTVRRQRLEAGGEAAHPSHWAPFVLVGGAGPASAGTVR